MLGFLRNILDKNKGEEIKPLKRFFEPKYFINQKHQKEFEENGFVVIRNVANINHISELKAIYETLSKLPEFKLDEVFVNSGRFQSEDIRQFVVDKIRALTPNISSKIFDSELCELKNGGNFQIKPASEKSTLNPHQDSPIIDETKFYAIYIWIPLVDISIKNGALTVLPGSHLWGNYQRSLNVPWKLESHIALLKKNMIPLEVKAGDVICFDSALIHASLPNLSDKIRLAVTTSALPKNYQLIEYFKDNKTPKDMVEVYNVDESYYVNQNINERPKQASKRLEKANPFIQKINKNQLRQILNL